MIDSLQNEVSQLLFLFYTSIGVIQRDAPAHAPRGAAPPGSPAGDTLRIENSVAEMIGSIVTTRNRISALLDALEREFGSEGSFLGAVEELVCEHRRVDAEIARRVAEVEGELPLLREYLDAELRDASRA